MLWHLRHRFPLHFLVFKMTASHLPHEANVEQYFSRAGAISDPNMDPEYLGKLVTVGVNKSRFKPSVRQIKELYYAKSTAAATATTARRRRSSAGGEGVEGGGSVESGGAGGLGSKQGGGGVVQGGLGSRAGAAGGGGALGAGQWRNSTHDTVSNS